MILSGGCEHVSDIEAQRRQLLKGPICGRRPAEGPDFDALHEEQRTQRAVMGWESELGKLSKVLTK